MTTGNQRTGGCSSFSVPDRSGLAVKFENTPSDWIPLPKTMRFEFAVADDAEAALAPGVLPPELPPVGGVGCDGVLLLPVPCCTERPESCLTNRWRSSGSSSESESSPSNASASVGSLTVRLRGATEDAREWNDGGGEEGTDPFVRRVWEGSRDWGTPS